MSFNRRQFMSVVAGTTVAATTMTLASAKTLSKTIGATPAAWDDLAKILGKNLYQPQTDNYYYKAAVNNLRYMNQLPQAVAVVDSPQTIQATIKWCLKNNIPFRIKGGGHSYAGFSTCPGLVISTEKLNTVDIRGEIATVGAGVINYNLYDALKAAKRTMTHGRCPTVGVAGFVMGGGIGFDMRRLGVASDHLISAQIVLANGQLVSASATENADLFWALRGGAGGNFGVATSFQFKTDDVSKTTISVFQRQYQIDDDGLTTNFLHHMMQTCQKMPNGFGSRISLRYADADSVQMPGKHFLIDFIGQWVGPEAQLKTFFESLYQLGDEPATGIKETVLADFTGPYWQAQDYLEDTDESSFYQERSTFIPDTPDKTSLGQAVRMLKQRPPMHNTCDLRFFQTGGVINDVSANATAFVHRSSQWLAVVGLYWGAQDESDPALIARGHTWQNNLYDFIAFSFHGKGAYQNFPDVSLKDWETAYYGNNLIKLKAVKRAYDRNEAFTFPQAIPAG
jgi:FAD/FMN-containing dehydrogenase